jgi:hypothetical protein
MLWIRSGHNSKFLDVDCLAQETIEDGMTNFRAQCYDDSLEVYLIKGTVRPSLVVHCLKVALGSSFEGKSCCTTPSAISPIRFSRDTPDHVALLL